MCILLLVQTNPNEQSHCPSQCELIIEHHCYRGLQCDSWTANNLIILLYIEPGSIKIRYRGGKKQRLVNIYLLDCSLEALCQRSNSCQSAVVGSSTDKKRLFQVQIYMQVLMRQGHEEGSNRELELWQKKRIFSVPHLQFISRVFCSGR